MGKRLRLVVPIRCRVRLQTLIICCADVRFSLNGVGRISLPPPRVQIDEEIKQSYIADWVPDSPASIVPLRLR